MSFMSQNAVDYFGGCPECGANDGLVFGAIAFDAELRVREGLPALVGPGVAAGMTLDVGREEWFVCDTHRTKWLDGSGNFSAHQHMTDDELDRMQARLAGYREVEPLPPVFLEGDP